MTVEEIKNTIDMEGLAYFIQSYASPKDMPTEKLKGLFEDALEALDALERALEDANI